VFILSQNLIIDIKLIINLWKVLGLGFPHPTMAENFFILNTLSENMTWNIYIWILS